MMGQDTASSIQAEMPGSLLVVDDDADDVQLALRTIGKLFPEMTARAVRSGEALISYLQGENEFGNRADFPYPLLVLLDLKMPGLDGFDVLRWLRDHPPHHFIPVIVLTGVGEMQRAGRAYALGARSFLTKPLRRHDLGNAVRGLQERIELVRTPVSSSFEMSL